MIDLRYYFCNIWSLYRYETAVSILASIFGPGAHKSFPKTQRLKGFGCDYDGFFPAGEEGGVDLEVEPDETVSFVTSFFMQNPN